MIYIKSTVPFDALFELDPVRDSAYREGVMNADQELLFKDLGATAGQTVEQVRGLEENYFSVFQRTMSAFLGSQT